MKIISYNVNGIRAALQKDLLGWLGSENPDVFCIQESKAQPEQIDTAPFEQLGYTAYIHSAQKRGYSGVVVFSKIKPNHVEVGMGNPTYDSEGRVLRLDFDTVSVLCVYVPSGSSGDERQAFKMQFLEAFAQHIAEVRKQCPNLVICGDFNICHKPIDINHPERQEGVSGFLPEERAWLDELEQSGMIDSFRQFDTSAERYSWWSYRGGARYRNAGWRIDYLWVSNTLKDRLVSGRILTEAVHSDHCPVLLEIN